MKISKCSERPFVRLNQFWPNLVQVISVFSALTSKKSLISQERPIYLIETWCILIRVFLIEENLFLGY